MLAGGSSTRFGSDKLSALYRDLPLVIHAVRTLAAVCDDVIVVTAPDGVLPELPPQTRLVRDPTPGEGPLAGVHTGLLAAVRSELAVVIGGDMPEVEPGVLRRMLEALQEPDVDVVALLDAGEVRPLPAAIRTGPGAEMAHALLHAGRRSLRDLLGALSTTALDEEVWTAIDPERRTLVDVDRPTDLRG